MEWTEFKKMDIHKDLKDHVDIIFRNNRYEVQLQFADKEKGMDGFIWLQFKDAINKDAIHDWREMQRIKNEICGAEREAVELFPAESRMVDTSNQFHLFVLPKGKKTGFGYFEREIVQGHNEYVQGVGGSKQRAFEVNPIDSMTKGKARRLMKKQQEKEN